MDPLIGEQTPARRRTWLQFGLIALALIETGYAMSISLPLDVGMMDGVLAKVDLIATPFVAAAAFAFALWNRLPQAIIALSAVMILQWAGDIGSTHLSAEALAVARVLRPITAVLAIALAARRTWLPLAAALLASTWLLWFSVSRMFEGLLFALVVMIFGYGR